MLTHGGQTLEDHGALLYWRHIRKEAWSEGQFLQKPFFPSCRGQLEEEAR